MQLIGPCPYGHAPYKNLVVVVALVVVVVVEVVEAVVVVVVVALVVVVVVGGCMCVGWVGWEGGETLAQCSFPPRRERPASDRLLITKILLTVSYTYSICNTPLSLFQTLAVA